MKRLGKLFLLAAALAAVSAAVFAARDIRGGEGTSATAVVNAGRDCWQLTLVNRDNPIDDGAVPPELTELSNGEQVDSRIYPELQAMFDDARAQGVYPVVNEGYRSRQRQQELMEEKIAAYEAEGYSGDTAQQLAAQWVAQPGTSEHELGLALDIIADSSRSTDDEVYAWLAENAWRYGFILRYPADKEQITGIDYEPWHYRYVGTQAAEEITAQGICLEEYLGAAE